MHVVCVNKRDMKKKEMIEEIREMILDSFFGEEWEQKLNFDKICANAKWVYGCRKSKKQVGYFTEEEVFVILNLAMDMKRMELDGIHFIKGRKRLLEKIKKEQNSPMDIEQDADLFFQCIKNEIIMEIYEQVTEYEEAEWIFAQQNFLDMAAAFVWIKMCVEQKNGTGQILPALHRIFPRRQQEEQRVENLLENVDSFEQFLGALWIEEADAFDKVCCLAEKGVDVSMLGRRFVENVIREQIENVVQSEK